MYKQIKQILCESKILLLHIISLKDSDNMIFAIKKKKGEKIKKSFSRNNFIESTLILLCRNELSSINMIILLRKL